MKSKSILHRFTKHYPNEKMGLTKVKKGSIMVALRGALASLSKSSHHDEQGNSDDKLLFVAESTADFSYSAPIPPAPYEFQNYSYEFHYSNNRWDSSNRSIKKKSVVRFHDRVMIHISKTEITQTEKAAAFYSQKEFIDIYRGLQQDVAEAISNILTSFGSGGGHGDNNEKNGLPKKCLRGLETFPDTRGYKIALMTRQRAVSTVLKGQSVIRNQQMYNENMTDSDVILSKMYSKVTRLDKLNALSLAKMDAEFVLPS